MDTETGGLSTRSEDASWTALIAGSYGGTSHLNARMAENLSPVFACVDVISSALASLPARIYRKEAGSRVLVDDHPAQRIIDEPNYWQSWADFVQWYIAQCLLYGNACAWIEIDGSETRLVPVPWTQVSVSVLRSSRLRYKFSLGAEIGAYNKQLTMPQNRIIHMRDRSDNGIVGISRLARTQGALMVVSKLQEAVEALWENGAFPSGAISVQGRLNRERREELRNQLRQEFEGSANRAKTLLLDAASTYQKIGVNPDDSEVLESRQWSVSEICRIFEVPPPLVQDYSHNTFTNASTAGQWFSRFTLAAWARKFELVFSRGVLDSSHFLELDMSAFQRADHGERWSAHQIALQNEVLSAEEVKRMEGL